MPRCINCYRSKKKASFLFTRLPQFSFVAAKERGIKKEKNHALAVHNENTHLQICQFSPIFAAQISTMKTTLLSTAYLPPIEYILKCMQGPVILEACEHYIKQSYRNRALIATANGIQTLSIPVVHVSSKMPVLDVRIDYATPWQRLHWKSIDTAYSGSPYFLYFQDYFRPFYEKKHEFLFDFNLELTQVILKLFGHDFQPQRTTEFVADYSQKNGGHSLQEDKYKQQEANSQQKSDSPWEEIDDLRDAIHPKHCHKADYPFQHPAYTQIFEDRTGFVPNLSIVDYLFNEGNRTVDS